NRCTHENQRLYREGIGAIMRDGGVVCPKHGSIFDACSGYCDNGEAADSTLLSVDLEIEDGQVYLVDEDMTYLHEGPADDDDDDDGPQSTSHLQF
ncbi:MAG: Rieske (2Fe-2S) protein, partial [Halovenus sp.]